MNKLQKQDYTQYGADDTSENLLRTNEKGEVSPRIWMPMAVAVSFLLAIANVSISFIAKYEARGVALQSIGSMVGNITPLLIISILGRFRSEKPSDMEKSALIPDQAGPILGKTAWFKWFYDIYYYPKLDDQGNFLENQWVSKIRWPRVFATVLIAITYGLAFYFVVMSYHYALIGNLNTGVLMSLTSARTIGCSVLFYIIFNQALKLYEMVAMILWTLAVVTIVLSADEGDDGADQETEKFYVTLAWVVLMLAILMQCIRAAVLKYFFGLAKEVNVSALYNFALISFDIFFLVYLVVSILEGFEFTKLDFLAATVSGVLWSVANYLTSYVYVRGKAGVANALIETKILYQTLFDSLIFGRYPNVVQYVGLIIWFIAFLLLLLGSQIKLR